MVVGVCRLTLLLPESQSLKDKRMVLRQIKDKATQKFNLAIAEVGDNDLLQSAMIGFAVVANERRFVESMVDKVIGFIDGMAKITEDEKDFIQYGDEQLAADSYAHWEPGQASPPGQNRSGRKPRAPKVAPLPFPWEKPDGVKK
jgi:uncharacterized protein YlxP (DUF503 family)